MADLQKQAGISTLVIQDAEIEALLKDPLLEKLGLHKTSIKDARGLLEQDEGVWYASADAIAEMPDAELLGFVLLHGCKAMEKWAQRAEVQKEGQRSPRPETVAPKRAASALEALRERHARLQVQTIKPNNAGAETSAGSDAVPDKFDSNGPTRERQVELDAANKNAQVTITFENQGMAAAIKLTAPKEGGRPATEEEIRKAITMSGVGVDLEEAFIERILNFPVYGRPIQIARGRPPIDGADGKILYRFETEYNIHPEIDEAGNVDYKEINYVNNVIKGDVLCEILLPRPPIDGYDVTGKARRGYMGKPATVKAGQNVVASEDGFYLIAACDGQPSLKGGQVVVNEILSVKRVDGGTGNITFFGCVEVLGDVSSGFSVNAGGDIIIKGFVGNAVLTAGGHVTLLKGMNGGGIGSITAGGCVRSKFLEQVQVKAGDHVFGDVVLNCDIECNNKMILSGKKGCFSGGSCRVSKELQVQTLGNEAELDTRVEIRDNEGALKQLEEKRGRRVILDGNVRRISTMAHMLTSTNLDIDSKRTGMIRAIFMRKRMQDQSTLLLREENMLSNALKGESSVGQVAVYGRLYPNVQVTIDGIFTRISVAHTSCAVRQRGGEIVFESSLPPKYAEKDG